MSDSARSKGALDSIDQKVLEEVSCPMTESLTAMTCTPGKAADSSTCNFDDKGRMKYEEGIPWEIHGCVGSHR